MAWIGPSKGDDFGNAIQNDVKKHRCRFAWDVITTKEESIAKAIENGLHQLITSFHDKIDAW